MSVSGAGRAQENTEFGRSELHYAQSGETPENMATYIVQLDEEISLELDADDAYRLLDIQAWALDLARTFLYRDQENEIRQRIRDDNPLEPDDDD